MKKHVPLLILVVLALFACKTKPSAEEITAADAMREEAVAAREKALSIRADQSVPDLFAVGEAALQAGDDAAAGEDYSAALQKYTESRDAFLKAFEQAGGSKYAEALEALRRAEEAIAENDEAIRVGNEEIARLDDEVRQLQEADE